MSEITVQYDVDGVIDAWCRRQFSDRPELIKTFTKAYNESKPFKKFMAEVAQAVLENDMMRPTQALGLACVYGMAIGTLLERERRGEL